MSSAGGILLLQLPLNPQALLEPTGNVPYAAGTLASAWGEGTAVLPQETADSLSDSALVGCLLDMAPETIGMTLYSWNVERSIRIARMLGKERPSLRLVAGGPEVWPDNGPLVRSGAFDALFPGEGERCLELVAGEASGLCGTPTAGRWTGVGIDPYASGCLDFPGDGSVLVETRRGCGEGCTYCAYRRSGGSMRTQPAEAVTERLRALRRMGAGEVVFLDPTLNGRTDLAEMLKGMKGLGLSCFGEVRAEMVGRLEAKALRSAGFASVEVGLQTMGREALEACGRRADPERVLEGAATLADEGVTPVVDLMLGLPGDDPSNVVEAAFRLSSMGLHGNVQVFVLSVLPGTPLRSCRMPPRHMDLPPYYVLGNGGGIPDGLLRAREAIADIVGYDLDLPPRPVVAEGAPGSVTWDLRSDRPAPQVPQVRHATVRAVGCDPTRDGERLARLVRRRLTEEPHCVLDLVMEVSGAFPLDVVDRLGALAGAVDYSGRTASMLGRQGNLRLSVLLGAEELPPVSWMESASEVCSVCLGGGGHGASRPVPPGLLADSGAYAVVDVPPSGLAELAEAYPDPHSVLPSDIASEQAWCRELLGL